MMLTRILIDEEITVVAPTASVVTVSYSVTVSVYIKVIVSWRGDRVGTWLAEWRDDLRFR